MSADQTEEDRQKAAALSERVGATLDVCVKEHAHELGIEERFVLAEFVWQATQRFRATRDEVQ